MEKLIHQINKIILGFWIQISQYPPLRLTQTGGAVSSEHMQTPLHYISFIPRQSDAALYSRYSQAHLDTTWCRPGDCLSSSGYRDIIPRGDYMLFSLTFLWVWDWCILALGWSCLNGKSTHCFILAKHTGDSDIVTSRDGPMAQLSMSGVVGGGPPIKLEK